MDLLVEDKCFKYANNFFKHKVKRSTAKELHRQFLADEHAHPKVDEYLIKNIGDVVFIFKKTYSIARISETIFLYEMTIGFGKGFVKGHYTYIDSVKLYTPISEMDIRNKVNYITKRAFPYRLLRRDWND